MTVGPDGQDRALSALSLAAGRARRRAGGGQRRAVGAGGQGLVLHRRAPVVLRHAGTGGRGRPAASRRAGRRRDRLRQPAGACARSGSSCWSPTRRWRSSAISSWCFRSPSMPRRDGSIDGSALIAGLIQAASHATAKAAMFMAAGMIYVALGHDRIANLGGVVRAAPIAALVFLLAGVALDRPADERRLSRQDPVPPRGRRHASMVVVARARRRRRSDQRLPGHAHRARAGAGRSGDGIRAAASSLVSSRWRRLALVLCSLLLGLLPWHAWLPLPVAVTAPDPLSLGALWSLVWPLLMGAALAALLGRREKHRPLRVALWLERADGALRQWPAAGFSLLGLTIMLGVAMLLPLH